MIAGAVNGQISAVIGKIGALHSKNAFALALIAGDLFADPQTETDDDKATVTSLLAGKIEVPLPTYFALGQHSLPAEVVEKLKADGEVCHNLYFLGKRTTVKTSEGIRIVALGGALDTNLTAGVSKESYLPFYSEDDAKALRGANSADVLITSEWPAEVGTGSKKTVPTGETITQRACVADLCSTLKPRYHFSTSPVFFEREPFFHNPTDPSDGYRLTRFLSLAPFGNPNKEKWIYAFSLDTAAPPPTTIPPGATASPLSFTSKKRAPLPEQNSYRFASDDSHQHRRPHKRQKAPPPTPGECFFCLSNPNVATHLITSIATDAYLTTAKGPLTTMKTFPSLAFPAHMLIIPLTHAPTLASMDPESRNSTFLELEKYRSALHKMLIAKSNSTLGSVTWEVSRSGGIHTHFQFLPVPADLVKRGLVEAAFKVEAENERYPAVEKRDVGDGLNEAQDYFRVIVWDPPAEESGKGRETHLVLPLDSSFRFDLQFGRRVLAKLLGLEGRMNWRDCGQSHEDEVADAEAFKEAFKPYDFALEDD